MMPATMRGRPVAPDTAEDYRDEITALRHEVAQVIPLSRYLFTKATIDGDRSTQQVASRIVHLLERAGIDPKDAA